MPATSWNSRLDDATTAHAVTELCDRFVTAWTFQELGQLPATCQPQFAVETGDVSPYALKLVAWLGERDAGAAPMLHRMSTFFSKAALRLAQIAEQAPDEGKKTKPEVFPYQ